MPVSPSSTSGIKLAPRKNPRISANKLAEYVSSSSSSKRKRIIEDAKYPPSFKTTLYKEVRNPIESFLLNGKKGVDIQRAIAYFKRKVAVDKKESDEINNSILALNSLLKTNLSELDKLKIENYDERSKYLFVKGVTVSVNPDMVVSKISAKGKLVGALKLHIIKNNKLQDDGQGIVALIVRKYVEGYIAKAGEVVKSNLCLSLDIFRQSLVSCPSSTVRIWNDVEIACEEIAARWDSI